MQMYSSPGASDRTPNPSCFLRHTFCSHLAMRSAPARAIQELAGHQNIMTTERYMHLNPTAIENAIRLLDHARPVSEFGDIVETA